MMRIFFTRWVLLLALVPAGLVAQGGAGQRIDAARREALGQGVPVGLLDSKVAEGAAKGVPLDRVAAAVERRLDALVRAKEAMGSGPRGAPVRSEELAVGADAVEAGVAPAALGALTSATASGRRAVAIAVLTQLVRGGMASDEALSQVTQALARGSDALRNLPARTEAAERVKGPPATPGSQGNANGHAKAGGGPPASVPRGKDNPHRGGQGGKKP